MRNIEATANEIPPDEAAPDGAERTTARGRFRPMSTERTFAMIKPDGVQRRLVGELIARIEAKGYDIVAMKHMTIPREMAETHYGEHAGKPFYAGLVSFITSGPVVAMVLEGENAIAGWRTLMGPTNPADAAPGTVRGDFATTIDENVAHGSDAPATAEREIGLFFPELS